MPRSHNRPAQVLTREVLVDVHDLVRDRLVDSVLQVAVVVEQPGAACHTVQVYAYHSELSETARALVPGFRRKSSESPA